MVGGDVLLARCVYKGPDPVYIDPVKQEEERLAKLVSIHCDEQWQIRD